MLKTSAKPRVQRKKRKRHEISVTLDQFRNEEIKSNEIVNEDMLIDYNNEVGRKKLRYNYELFIIVYFIHSL